MCTSTACSPPEPDRVPLRGELHALAALHLVEREVEPDAIVERGAQMRGGAAGRVGRRELARLLDAGAEEGDQRLPLGFAERRDRAPKQPRNRARAPRPRAAPTRAAPSGPSRSRSARASRSCRRRGPRPARSGSRRCSAISSRSASPKTRRCSADSARSRSRISSSRLRRISASVTSERPAPDADDEEPVGVALRHDRHVRELPEAAVELAAALLHLVRERHERRAGGELLGRDRAQHLERARERPRVRLRPVRRRLVVEREDEEVALLEPAEADREPRRARRPARSSASGGGGELAGAPLGGNRGLRPRRLEALAVGAPPLDPLLHRSHPRPHLRGGLAERRLASRVLGLEAPRLAVRELLRRRELGRRAPRGAEPLLDLRLAGRALAAPGRGSNGPGEAAEVAVGRERPFAGTRGEVERRREAGATARALRPPPRA